jgi:hypothetical protein
MLSLLRKEGFGARPQRLELSLICGITFGESHHQALERPELDTVCNSQLTVVSKAKAFVACLQRAPRQLFV